MDRHYVLGGLGQCQNGQNGQSKSQQVIWKFPTQTHYYLTRKYSKSSHSVVSHSVVFTLV